MRAFNISPGGISPHVSATIRILTVYSPKGGSLLPSADGLDAIQYLFPDSLVSGA